MIHCYLIDDETHALDVLARYVTQTPGLCLLGTEENPLVALQAVSAGDVCPELVFLDVDMPQLSGLDLARLLTPFTKIVYTTAYPDFALQAFEQNVLDYLLKPITYERFLQAVQKVQVHFRQERPTACAQGDFFYIKGEVKGKLVRIRLEEILYVEALQNYIQLHTTEGKHITYLTMKEIAEHLPPEVFVRVHKSFIVHTRHVTAVEGNRLVLDTGQTLTLGPRYREEFLAGVHTRLIKSKRLP